jgi:ribosomal protein S3
MGHKVHPTGIRLGIAKDWNSKWFANKGDYAKYLVADIKVRDMLKKKLAAAGISKIQIERPAKTARVTIHTARPGVVIGKKGEDIEKLRKEVSDMMGVPTHINVNEVRKPELDAQLVAESIAQQLERRIMFRRAMKRSVGNAMRLGALGIKINVSGRLGACRCIRCAPTSTTAPPRRRPPTASSASRCGSTRVRSSIWQQHPRNRRASRLRSRAAKVVKVVVTIRVARPVTAAASGLRSKESCHVATQANQIPQAVQRP